MEFFNLPNNPLYHKIFYGNPINSWQTWTKPDDAKFVYMYIIGAGGTGGGGRTGGFNAGGGGGGGGSSSITVALYPAFLVPDTLYIRVGIGLSGSTAGTGGGSGSLSYVTTYPNTSAIYVLGQSGNAVAGGGAGGTNTGTGAGAGGTGGSAWTYAGYPLAALGLVSSTVGQTGGAGGGNIPASGVSITPIITITGGAGGGGVSAAATPLNGGDITGSGFLPTITGGTGGSGTVQVINGRSGFMAFQPTTESYMSLPMMFTGGAGGGSNGNGIGGFGGNAAYGSGGGGGGASYNSTGGNGGSGGDGLVLITCF